MELFTYLMAKNDHNTSVKKDLFSYLLGKGQSGTYSSFSGTSISANNTKKGKMILDLYGNTSQVSYTGKNLFNAQTQAGVYGNAIYTVSSNGEISQSATDTSAFGNDQARNFQLSAGTYTISIINRPSNVYLQLRNISNNTNILENKTDSYTFTLNETTTLACKTWSSDTTLYPISYYIQIETGSTATSYEPYVGGTASPNPSYPQQIHTVTGDNTIKVCGKQLFEYQYILTPNDSNKNAHLEAGTYTIATCDSNNFGTNVYFKLFDKNGSAITSSGHLTATGVEMNFSTGSYNYYGGAGASSITFTIDSNYTLAIGLLNADGTRQVMLVKGSTADRTYQAYTGSSYPITLGSIELCKIGTYKDRFLRNSGKNLLNLANGSYTSNGIITTITNGEIHSSGTTDSTWFNLIANSSYALKAGTYTFSIDSTISTNTLTLALKGESWHNFTIAKNGTKATLTLDEDVDTISITTGGFSSGTAINFTIHIMLNEGSTALPYEPYGNGEWYLEKKIGKKVLNGSENFWVKSGASSSSIFVASLALNENAIYSKKETGNVWLTDKFGIGTGLTQENTFFPYNPDDTWGYRNLGFSISTNVVNDLATWETWLANNNITWYYVLFSPTYTKITGTYDTLASQLETAWRANSYKGQTNISQVNNDLPFYLEAQIKVSQ